MFCYEKINTLYLWKTIQQLTTKNEVTVLILTDNLKKCSGKASCKGMD